MINSFQIFCEAYYDSLKPVDGYVNADDIIGQRVWVHTNRTHRNNKTNGMIGIYNSTESGRKTGPAGRYTNEIRLKGPIHFQTSKSGSEMIKNRNTRFLIAGVSGVVIETNDSTEGMQRITYNPFEHGYFHLIDDDKEIVSASEVYFRASESGNWDIWVKDPVYSENISEAFKSKAIRTLLSYLKPEDKKKALDFITLTLLRTYGLQVDKIQDKDVTYLRKDEAIKYKNEETNNPQNLKWLKIWFSVEDGYLGKTETYDKEENVTTLDADNVTDFRNRTIHNIPHLSKAIIELSSGRRTRDVIGIVYRDQYNDNIIYLLHNDGDFAGGDPGTHAADRVKRENDVRYSWQIDTGNTRQWSNIRQVLEIDESATEYYKWHSNYEIIKEADFAIIFDYDSIYQKNTNRNKIRGERAANKQDALVYMNNDLISSRNMDKYLTTVVKKMGITESGINDIKLQKVIRYCSGPNFFGRNVDAMVVMFKLIHNIDVNHRRGESFKRFLEQYRIYYKSYIKNKKTLIKVLETAESEEERLFLREYFDILNDIEAYIKDLNIDNLKKYKLAYHKLYAIQKAYKDTTIFNVPGPIRSYLNYLTDIDEVEYSRRNYTLNFDVSYLKEFREHMRYLGI